MSTPERSPVNPLMPTLLDVLLTAVSLVATIALVFGGIALALVVFFPRSWKAIRANREVTRRNSR